MLIAVSSFGESLRWDNLTAPAEAVFKLSYAILFSSRQDDREGCSRFRIRVHPYAPPMTFNN